MVIAKKGSRGAAVKMIQKWLKLNADGVFGPLTEEAVIEFQKDNGLVADGVVGVKTWCKMFGYMLLPSKRTITEIIVHCSATPAGKNYTVDDITRWHKARGFNTIGYHYVVYRDGSIHYGRDVNVAGAHCTGHNTHSIGVCYIGGMDRENKRPADSRTWAQREALTKLLMQLKGMYPHASIHGHRDFANKACPSFDATKEYKTLSELH